MSIDLQFCMQYAFFLIFEVLDILYFNIIMSLDFISRQFLWVQIIDIMTVV